MTPLWGLFIVGECVVAMGLVVAGFTTPAVLLLSSALCFTVSWLARLSK